MCFYIATTELRRRRYVVVLESVSTYFVVDELILLFVALVELVGLRMLYLLFMKSLVVCE